MRPRASRPTRRSWPGWPWGTSSAAVTFVRRYQRRVFGLAYSMTGDTGVAEDVAQEALLRAWRHAPVFDPRRGSVSSWVLTITRNLTIDALRMRRAVPTDPDDFAASAQMSNEHLPEDALRRGTSRDGPAGARRAARDARRAVVLAAVYGTDRAGDQRVGGHSARDGQDEDQNGADPTAQRNRAGRRVERGGDGADMSTPGTTREPAALRRTA